MPDVKLTIPDAWVTEWNVLFVVPSAYGDLRKAADAANAILAEWDYPITLSPSDFRPKGIRRWVDPAVICDEQWPNSGFSSEPVEGWVKVYRIDLDDLSSSPPRPPWIDPKSCFGHCDPEGWHVPCNHPNVEVGGHDCPCATGYGLACAGCDVAADVEIRTGSPSGGPEPLEGE